MDGESRENAFLSMKEMKSSGTSIVITSHEKRYFEGLADLNFELKYGKLVELGNSKKLTNL